MGWDKSQEKNGEKVQQLCNFSFFFNMRAGACDFFPFQPEVSGRGVFYDWEHFGGSRGAYEPFLVIDIKGIQRRYGYVLSCFNK